MLKRVITPQEVAMAKKDFEECRNVVVVCHTSPDGDAIGSSLGLYEYLKRKGKQVTVIVPNYFPDFLHWMKDADKIVRFDRQKAASYAALKLADLICCLDFNDMRRIDELGVAVERMRCKRLLIDHHLDPVREQFGHIISHPEMSSTSELLFRLLDAMGETKNLTFAAAEDLYAGIATDTGFFSFNSNDPDLFVIVSELNRLGRTENVIMGGISFLMKKGIREIYCIKENVLINEEFISEHYRELKSIAKSCEMEYDDIIHRMRTGYSSYIENARKTNGKIQVGRSSDYRKPKEQYFSQYSKEIDFLMKGELSLRQIHTITGTSIGTLQKLKHLINQPLQEVCE